MKNLHPGETLSLWQHQVKMPRFSKLEQNIECDVCIVGGGIAGLTTAYTLMKEGKRVCLLEDYELASGQTGHTSAHVTAILDSRYYKLEKTHGRKGANLAAQSHMAALKKIERIIESEKIECDFEKVNAYLFAENPQQASLLPRELIAVTHAGLPVHYLQRVPITCFYSGPALMFPDQIQIHPLKYLRALTQILQDSGVQIFTHTHVSEIKGGKSATVKAQNGFSVKANAIVVATNTPINDLFAIHTKQAAYRSYVTGFKIPKNSVPKAFYWDSNDPYHYVRVQSDSQLDYDILIVGGEDHKTGQDTRTDLRFCYVEQWARSRFPMIEQILYTWSGQIMESVDGLAFLGHNPMDRDNVYVITGDSGNGITSSTIGAMLITDQIMGRKNEWEDLYNPSRFTMTAEYLKENANVAAQYYNWLTSKPKPNFESMEAGEGKVFRDGLDMIAVYKDEKQQLKFMSAACTHLGGIVNWNETEKSWDCPCHGARFNCEGKVIEGPAISDLKKIEAEKFRDDVLESMEAHHASIHLAD